MHTRVAEQLKTLPAAPGVYLMRNSAAKVIYVGKAKSLRERVRGYFTGADTRAFVALLDTLLADLEVILTGSEKEAFLLENELIKAHSPRFNIKLTDDKRFLCLRLDSRKLYPRLEVVRRFKADGARYFGPYHSASAIRETLRLVNRHFQLRTCSDQMMRSRQRPCLQYQIKRCPAPCVFDLKDGPYARNVAAVTAFLEGRHEALLSELSARMAAAAAATEFETAALLRDQIHAVRRSLERQRLVSPDRIDRDVLGLYREGPAVEIHVTRTREGRPIDPLRYSFADTEIPAGDLLSDFAGRLYDSPQNIPAEILFPAAMEWGEALAQVLSERCGHAVRVATPKRGDKLALVTLAERNAAQSFADKQREAGAAKTAVERLQRALRLRRPPHSLECFDISHLQGTHIVASAVRLQDGRPQKSLYRRYKIRTTAGQDDFKSMYEVISRRAQRGLRDADFPDLIVVDGGKGQLAAARAALDDQGVTHVDLVGLAKSRLLAPPTSGSRPRARARLGAAGGARVPARAPTGPGAQNTPSADDAAAANPARIAHAPSPADADTATAAHAEPAQIAHAASHPDAVARTVPHNDLDRTAHAGLHADAVASKAPHADLDQIAHAAPHAGIAQTTHANAPHAARAAPPAESDAAAHADAAPVADTDGMITADRLISAELGAGAPGESGDSADDSDLFETDAEGRTASAERVFVHGQREPIVLRQNSAELFMLTRARDEAHRFAITFHRQLRGKAATRSPLDAIAGIGPKRRRLLLRTFGSLSRVREATPEQLAEVVGPQLAATIAAALREA